MLKLLKSHKLIVGVIYFLSVNQLFGAQTVGISSHGKYRIKPSEVIVPNDVPLGKYRRVIQPFSNWTLVCDENINAKQKICNVTQVIVDQNDELVLNISLAATKEGAPFFFVRTPSNIDKNKGFSVLLPSINKIYRFEIDGCNDIVCVGKFPVLSVINRHILNKSIIDISYYMGEKNELSVRVMLDGLSSALNSLD